MLTIRILTIYTPTYNNDIVEQNTERAIYFKTLRALNYKYKNIQLSFDLCIFFC